MQRFALWLFSLSTVFALLLVLCCGDDYDYDTTPTPDYYDSGTIDYDQYSFVYPGSEETREVVFASNERSAAPDGLMCCCSLVPHLLPLLLGLAALQLCQML